MRPVYSARVLRDQYMFGLKKYAHGQESVVDEEGPGPVLFRRPMQRSQQSILACGLTQSCTTLES